MSEWSRYDEFPLFGGLERLRASFRSHAFVRHSHDYYVIGMIRQGVQSFEYGRKHFVTPNGAMCIINPGEMHTGQAKTAGGFEYQAIYPSAALMERVAAEVHGRNTGLPWFNAAVVADDDLVTLMLGLHQSLDVPLNALEWETRLLAALTALVNRYANVQTSQVRVRFEQPAAQQMRDFLEAHYSTSISLDELAKLCNFSPWYAARVFQQVYSLPPHAYLEGVRIRHARIFLKQGHPPAWVAATTGFVDQSHFTRRFKRHLGVTPGEYAQLHKNVQYNRPRS